jgi:hypothetical protein
MALDTYAHLFAEFEDARISATDLIRRARARNMSPDVSVLCPRGDDPITVNPENPCKPRADAGTRTPDPFITSSTLPGHLR